MGKISKDKYFMSLAQTCSVRSLDPDTQHGCVAVDSGGAVLSTGYNGPPRGVDDSKIPLTRPDKYIYMEHAERNCIYNAARIGVPLYGCTFYVTGIPCLDCLRAIYQAGASRIVCQSKVSHCLDSKDQEFLDFIKYYMEIEIWN